MAAPATHESKPGSTARDAAGGAGPQCMARDRSPGGCRARANRRRRLRARTMAPHNPTTGLFQGNGGWFRAGAEYFITEEGLIEDVEAGREPASRQSMRRDKRVNTVMAAPCAPRRPPRTATPQYPKKPARPSVQTPACFYPVRRTELADSPVLDYDGTGETRF